MDMSLGFSNLVVQVSCSIIDNQGWYSSEKYVRYNPPTLENKIGSEECLNRGLHGLCELPNSEKSLLQSAR